MLFLALGVEHKTSPLSIREAVTMDGDAAAQVAVELHRAGAIDEIAILSTCNRTEIYLVSDNIDAAGEVAIAHLAAIDGAVVPYLQIWREMDAAEHLFRVAAGLESQALGEAEILSQVRETLAIAERSGTIGTHLHALFRAAISCARRARAGTALGRINRSLGAEAVHAAESALGSLAECSALLIGGGAISRLVAAELRARTIGALFIVNRTESVAIELAGRYGGQAAPLAALADIIPRVDLIISATSAPRFMLTPETLLGSAPRLKRPLLIYDLAIPRDVDPAVGALPGITLHDLDDLLPSGLLDQWNDDIRTMEAIIAAEVKEFSVWYLTRRVVPVIASLRAHVEAVSETELRRVAPQLENLTEREWAAVESLTGRLIDKMFHHLVVRLRLAAQSDPKLVEAAEFFFLHGEGGLFEHAATRDITEAMATEDVVHYLSDANEPA